MMDEGESVYICSFDVILIHLMAHLKKKMESEMVGRVVGVNVHL